MNETSDDLTPISAEKTLREITEAIPEDCRKNVIVIGSLAVGYHYFRGQRAVVVRTKDADCLLSPHFEAIQAGVTLTERLIENHWTLRQDGQWTKPGNADTLDQDLPAVRLHPPGRSDWFLELLTVPRSSTDRKRRWTRLQTRYGHFGLCSFGFLSLANYQPIETDLGIRIARPEMMALTNLLEHPTIRTETMSGLIGGRRIKRSNKDLGRVLAISHLATGAEEDALMEWPEIWQTGLGNRFPQAWADLAKQAGKGLRALLASEPDLEDARQTCESGLLASNPPTLAVLQAAGQRLIVDAIEPLEASGAEADS